MKKLLCAAFLAVPFVFAACGGEPGTEPGTSEPSVQKTEETKVCPYLVPYCPTDCKLVGGCPQQCVCDNGQSTLCGTQHCGANQYCCSSTTVGYECLAIGQMCPL